MRFQEILITEDSYTQNFYKINTIVTQQHKDDIKKLLSEMFPKQREIIEFAYKDEVPFAEWRKFIYEIDKWVLTGPVTLQPNQIPPLKDGESQFQNRYDQYIKNKEAGRPARYFRQNDADPRQIDFSKLPPITVAKSGTGLDVVDGNHRSFLARKANQPLRAYVWNNATNTHPNVTKIKSLFAEIQESWSKKYKKSINCANPKGFSQKAHCAGRKARQSGRKTSSKAV